jgi:hypothetical protein
MQNVISLQMELCRRKAKRHRVSKAQSIIPVRCKSLTGIFLCINR